MALMECFIEDLLSYNMIQEGAFQLNPVVFELSKVLDFIKSTFQHKFNQKSLELTVKFVPKLTFEEKKQDSLKSKDDSFLCQSRSNLIEVGEPDKLLKSARELSDGEVPTLHGDETRLKQVLLNLVKNSFKFTDTGRVEVELSYDSYRGTLIGQVRDTGKGIAQEDKDKLFSRFGKLSRTADVNHEGIGLGLTIVKSIIEQHKGKIDVDSQGIG